MQIFGLRAVLGRIYSRLFGKQLVGVEVIFKIEDCANPNLVGSKLEGKIHSLPLQSFTVGPAGTTKHGPGSLILELSPDSRRLLDGMRWLLATPRWQGHAASRLFIAPIVVTLAKIEAQDPSPSARYEDILATAILRLHHARWSDLWPF